MDHRRRLVGRFQRRHPDSCRDRGDRRGRRDRRHRPIGDRQHADPQWRRRLRRTRRPGLGIPGERPHDRRQYRGLAGRRIAAFRVVNHRRDGQPRRAVRRLRLLRLPGRGQRRDRGAHRRHLVAGGHGHRHRRPANQQPRDPGVARRRNRADRGPAGVAERVRPAVLWVPTSQLHRTDARRHRLRRFDCDRFLRRRHGAVVPSSTAAP